MTTILLLAPDQHRRAILEAFAGAAGYELQPRRVLTTAERLVRLEDAVRSQLGPLGERLLASVDR